MTVNGELLPSGTFVDVSEWRNAKSLENMRYIAFVIEDETPQIPKPKIAKPKNEVKAEEKVEEKVVEISLS